MNILLVLVFNSFFSFASSTNYQRPNLEGPLAIVPKVDFDFWNNSDHVYDNNCYNYSVNRMTDNFAQPGEASGKEYKALTCHDVQIAAAADLGLELTNYFPFSTKEDDTLIALVVDPGWDYHWYRRGDDNMWTHKMGNSPATNLDESQQEISDVELADTGSYTDFCGYFKVKNFPQEVHEQNAGYARIGNMKSLPEDAPILIESRESRVITLKYSGRRNPEQSLRSALKSSQFKSDLESVSRQLKSSSRRASSSQRLSFSKLGYRGILIDDREGLIFPKGSKVYLNESLALHYQSNDLIPQAVDLVKPMSSLKEVRQ